MPVREMTPEEVKEWLGAGLIIPGSKVRRDLPNGSEDVDAKKCPNDNPSSSDASGQESTPQDNR